MSVFAVWSDLFTLLLGLGMMLHTVLMLYRTKMPHLVSTWGLVAVFIAMTAMAAAGGARLLVRLFGGS